MFSSVIKAFSIKELRSKILFTCLCIVLFKFVSLIPMPGVDSEVAKLYFSGLSGKMGDLFKMVNVLSGGAFSGMTLLALSIGPYVSATIFVQVYATLSGNMQRELSVSPSLARRKIGMMSRYVTVVLACIQAASFAKYALYINGAFPSLISNVMLQSKVLFYSVFIFGMSAGTMFIMWLAEMMTQKGVGNGVSIVISTGILSSSYKVILESAMTLFYGLADRFFFITSAMFIALFSVVLIWSILLSLGQKEVPVVYAKRVVGNKLVQGKGLPFLPLKVNYVGILPVMFASSVLMFASTIAGFTQKSFISNIFVPTSISYAILYILLIFSFSYIWTSIQFRPKSIASDLKRAGAFIPGIKQGAQTEKYLFSEMHKTNLLGTSMLCFLALIPIILERMFFIERTKSYLVGGTTLLLLVGTVVDVFSQVSGYMASNKKSGFTVKKKV